jgi:hypothetical protein
VPPRRIAFLVFPRLTFLVDEGRVVTAGGGAPALDLAPHRSDSPA